MPYNRETHFSQQEEDLDLTPERWQQVAEAFEAALELGTEQRSAFLAKLGSDDASLKSEVETLLRKTHNRPKPVQAI